MKKYGSHPRGGMKKMMDGAMMPGKGRHMPEVHEGPVRGAPHSDSARHGAASGGSRGAKSNVHGY